MKNLLRIVFIVALATFANTTFAQKLAHINRTELIQSMPDFKTAVEKLEAYGKELQSETQELQAEYLKKLQDYQQNYSTWTDEKKQVAEEKLTDLQGRIQEQDRVNQNRMDNKQEELFTPILKKVTDAINKIAKAGGYVFVFESTAVHYVDETQSTNLISAAKTELGI